MTVTNAIGAPNSGQAPSTIGPKLFRLDGSVKKDNQFKIEVQNFDANSMTGTVKDSQASHSFTYSKPSAQEANGSLVLDGEKRILSHNNYLVLRNAFEQKFKAVS